METACLADNFPALQTEECEGLLTVLRELTQSRNSLMNLKSVQGERLADLQNDFLRVTRIADLSRALSRENMAKAAHLSNCLNQVRQSQGLAENMFHKRKENFRRG